MVVEVGETLSVPPVLALHPRKVPPPPAQQDVAVADGVHVSVDDPPLVIEVGLAVRVRVGTLGLEQLAFVPTGEPVPEQVQLKVVVVSAGELR